MEDFQSAINLRAAKSWEQDSSFIIIIIIIIIVILKNVLKNINLGIGDFNLFSF